MFFVFVGLFIFDFGSLFTILFFVSCSFCLFVLFCSFWVVYFLLTSFWFLLFLFVGFEFGLVVGLLGRFRFPLKAINFKWSRLSLDLRKKPTKNQKHDSQRVLE